MSVCRAHVARRPVLAAALTVGLCLGINPADTDARPVTPNIVLILTDDEDVGIHAFMLKTKALLEDQGTTFANFFVSYPWCCPSRATILRGQYAHNTGIVGNEPPGAGSRSSANWVSRSRRSPSGCRPRLFHRDGRQIHQPLRAGEKWRAIRLGRVVRRWQRASKLQLQAQ
jgi:hypothetical protein